MNAANHIKNKYPKSQGHVALNLLSVIIYTLIMITCKIFLLETQQVMIKDFCYSQDA